MMQAILLDIRYALRQLFKSPKFTALTLAVLVGGLSVALFTFSFLYTTVYKPLPLPEGESVRAVTVYNNGKFRLLTAHDFAYLKKATTDFAEFGLYDQQDIRLSIEDSGKSYSGALVQAGFFEFSRIKPMLGRTFTSEDNQLGAPAVAIISAEIWQQDFQQNPAIIGSVIKLDGVDTQVVGVMPKGYRFPNTARVWLPLSNQIFTVAADKSAPFRVYARVKPGVDDAQLEQQLTQTLMVLHKENVARYDLPEVQKQVKLETLQMAQTGGDGTLVFVFLNIVSWLILLLACINVGNLLLARIIEKQKETAIRAALGAKSARLVSQLMWEGVLICLLGGVLSLCLVGGALEYVDRLLHAWIPLGGSFWWRYGMDLPTVLMALAYTLVTIFLATFLPAWRSARQDVNMTLRDGTRGAQGKKVGKLSRMLVTTQVFIVATLMLIGSIAAFIAHQFLNLSLGDNYDNVMGVRFTLEDSKYTTDQERVNALLDLLNNVENSPSVQGVVMNSWLGQRRIELINDGLTSSEQLKKADVVSHIGRSSVVGITLLEGREFNAQDTLMSRKVVLVSESLAKRYWPNQSPLEKQLKVNLADNLETVTVVGVVSNRMNPTSMFGRLDSEDEVYVSGRQYVQPSQVFLYRVARIDERSDEIFYQAIYRSQVLLDLEQAVAPASRNRNKMRESMQLLANITFSTSFFALLLALVGIYGLTANAVAQRTHEIGIRRAVGAKDSSITWMFLRQGAKQLLTGLGLALCIFALLAAGFHQLTEALFPVYAYFVMGFTVTVGLSVVVMLAVYFPTKRAILLEPSEALRYE